LPVATSAPGVDLIASSIWLMSAEKVLSSEPGAEKILVAALRKLPRRWDVIMIDSSPFLGTLTLSALTACDELVVPVDATASGLQGTRDLLATVNKVQERLNPKLRVTAYVPSRVNEDREVDREVVEALRAKFGRLVTKPMHESARIKKAEMYSKPITLYAPKSSAAQEFRALAADISRRS
jgi:chromosome partitioning protein